MRRQSRLGEILIQAGLIDERAFELALQSRPRFGGRLVRSLVELDLVEESELAKALSRKLGVATARLDGKRIDPDVLELLPRALIEQRACLPLFTKREGGIDVLYLGMEDASDLDALDDASFHAGLKVRPVLLRSSQLDQALEACFGPPDPVPEVVSVPDEAPLHSEDTAPMLGDLPAAPVVAAPEVEETAEVDSPPSPEKPRDVETRTILHAITQLLIEKELLTRQEILERVRALRLAEAAEDGDSTAC